MNKTTKNNVEGLEKMFKNTLEVIIEIQRRVKFEQIIHL